MTARPLKDVYIEKCYAVILTFSLMFVQLCTQNYDTNHW